MLESVARTGALVTAEEGTLTGGVGAEIAARVQELAWGDLRAPDRRVAARDGIVPSARAARGRDAPGRRGHRRRGRRARGREELSAAVLEIVLTREDANTESALLAEWLVEDGAEVAGGQAVCVVETTKATVEIEAPGRRDDRPALRRGHRGRARQDDRARRGDRGRAVAAAPGGWSGETPRRRRRRAERKVTRKAAALAERHGVDSRVIEKRGFVTEKDVEALIAQPGGGRAAAGPRRSSPASRPRA